MKWHAAGIGIGRVVALARRLLSMADDVADVAAAGAEVQVYALDYSIHVVTVELVRLLGLSAVSW